MIVKTPLLCVISDEAYSPITIAQAALEGGARMIQLRHKHASGKQLVAWAQEITSRCKQYDAVCIINDRVDIAMASHAHGVHLGQDDLPALTARQLLGKQAIIGVSTSSLDEALQAEADGANYIGFGHIFPTSSKEKSSPPVGLAALQHVAQRISIPIIAIGGITLENAAAVMEHGATGIAVISAVSRAAHPTFATQQLMAAINSKQ